MESYFYKKELDALRSKLSSREVINIEKQADRLFLKENNEDEVPKYEENKLRLYTIYNCRKISLRKYWIIFSSVVFIMSIIISTLISSLLYGNRNISTTEEMWVIDTLKIPISNNYYMSIDSIKSYTAVIADSDKVWGQFLIYHTNKQVCDTVKATVSFAQTTTPPLSNNSKLKSIYFYLHILFIAYLIALVLLVMFLKPNLLKLCEGHFKKEHDEYYKNIKTNLDNIRNGILSHVNNNDMLRKKLEDHYNSIQRLINNQKYKKAISEIKKAEEDARSISEINNDELDKLLEKLKLLL